MKTAERLARRAGSGVPLTEDSASGRHDVGDTEWNLVAPILEGADTGRGGEPVDVRLLVDGMLCLARPDATPPEAVAAAGLVVAKLGITRGAARSLVSELGPREMTRREHIR